MLILNKNYCLNGAPMKKNIISILFLCALSAGAATVEETPYRIIAFKGIQKWGSKSMKLATYLKSLTGADAGSSYRQWYHWAVFHGYIVRGANTIQFLFSGYRNVRKKAVGHAIALLGYKNHHDFFHKHGVFKDDHRLSLFLADLLVKKGFLRDEQY